MLHTITKRLDICIDINTEISEVDHYTWIFTSRIFRLALEITFLLKKYFFLQLAYELTSQSRKLNEWGGFLISGGTPIREPRVRLFTKYLLQISICTFVSNLKILTFSKFMGRHLLGAYELSSSGAELDQVGIKPRGGRGLKL